MRIMRTRGKWLIDLMFIQRDSFSLHLFCLCIVKGTQQFKTPDLKIPVPIKPIKL